jgi:putative ABC transport system permease protein
VEEIQKQAGVISASSAHYHPADVFQSMEFSVGGQTYPFGFRMVDAGVFETLDINLIERFGSPTGKLEGWVINESFYKELLLDFSPEVVATSDFSSGNENQEDLRTQFEIGGVMEDFHYSSLHNTIGNFAFVIRDQETHYNRWLLVRFSEGRSAYVLKAIGQLMNTHFPGKAYDQFLLEDNLKEQYEASYKLSKVIRLFSLLSVLIAISGLYGLSLYMTRKRTKEIGIRKIHGSSTRQIIVMLNLGFQKWVGIAFALACPVTLWALRKWLMNFAYQTAMPWWIFAVSGIIIAAIAMIAVTWQTSSAARSNPVATIRSE